MHTKMNGALQVEMTSSEIIQSLSDYQHFAFPQGNTTSPALFVHSDVNMTFGR